MVKKTIFLVILCSLFFNACSRTGKTSGASAGMANDRDPVRIIFDTDLGNDIDDVLALQMLLNYHKKGTVDLLAVTISKANPSVIEYIDGYCRHNEVPEILMGYVYNGVTPEDGNYVKQTLNATFNGEKILKPLKSLKDSIPVAFNLIRKILSEQPDSSVVLAVVGPETNISRLLMSEADEYSPLNGEELVRKKVKLISVMGGHYVKDSFPEWNIITDLEAAQNFFSRCPVPIVASGFEIGNALLYPGKSIVEDFPDKESNPLYVSYSYWGQMPYDRPSWDLTSVLVVADPGKEYFRLSPPGKIIIDDKGNSIFSPDEGGTHRYLILNETNKDLTLNALIKAVTTR
jgi:purine nucleosidase